MMALRNLRPLRTTARQAILRPSFPSLSASLVTASKTRQGASAASTATTKSSPSPTPTRIPSPQVSGAALPNPPAYSPADSASRIDWTSSFHGLGTSAFPPEVIQVLQAPLNPDDIEVKPDGIIYLPEIKYRRILNAAFGPGGWGLAPRGELEVHDKMVTREYALIAQGRFVGQARGEQQYFNEDGVATAAEGCKSNALTRCCKDLGIASELWDPRFIRKYMKDHAHAVWAEHISTKKKKQIWLRKDDEVRYPFKKV